MKRLIGILLMILPFAVMGYFMFLDVGIEGVLIVLGTLSAILACITAGAYLLGD